MSAKLRLLIGVLTVIAVTFVGRGVHSQAQDKASPRAGEKGDAPAKDAMDEVLPEIKKGVRVEWHLRKA